MPDGRPGTPRRQPGKNKTAPGAARTPGDAGAADDLRREAEARVDGLSAAAAAAAAASPVPEDIAAIIHELRVHQIELEMQNEELRRAQIELDEQREQYLRLFNLAPMGYLTLSDKGLVTDANVTAGELLGVERQVLVGQPFGAFVFAADSDDFYLRMVELHKTAAPLTFELRLQRVDGGAGGAAAPAHFWALCEARLQPLADDAKPTTWLAFTDISRSKDAQRLLATQSEILGILATRTSVTEACEGVVAALRGALGFDAVGLRLKEGDDYPFLASVGYSDEFLQAENTLAVRYPDGGICRHDDGTVDLECTCGLVLRGDTDPANPLFTAGGSAWTNDSLPLLDVPPEDDPRLHPRNRCIHVGFRSIALIPLRTGDEILGLLHLADRRTDRFTAESVRFYEGFCATIGIALQHKLAVKALWVKNAVFDAATVAISVAAPDGSLVEVNEAFLQVWGYQSADEVLGRSMGAFLNDENETAAIVTALNEHAEWRGDYVARRKDGSTFIANGLATVLLDADGTLSGYQSAVTDVTARRRTEENLADAQRTAHLGSWELDIAEGALVWSDEIYRLFEIDPSEFAASYDAFLDAIHPEDREAVDAAYAASLEARTPYAIDHRLLFPDGRIKHVHEECHTVYGEDGAPLRSRGTVQDITERKRAEDEIRRLNAELQKRVVSRTEQLDAATRELEALAYSIAHDVRTPLRAIDGFSALVIEDEGDRLTAEGMENLRRARAAAQTLARLMDELVGLSALSRRELVRRRVDLTALSKQVAEEIAADNPSRQVDLVVAPGLGAEADPRLVRVILSELLGNAWKFSAPHGSARVEVGALDLEDERAFFVRDDGVGFDPAYATHLFGVFQRMHTPGRFEGVGVGLATVQRLVRRHGGRVWAEAEVETGATFFFTLPPSAHGD